MVVHKYFPPTIAIINKTETLGITTNITQTAMTIINATGSHGVTHYIALPTIAIINKTETLGITPNITQKQL